MFKRSSYKDIIDYFDDHIEYYDNYASNPYWSFSDDLLKYIIKKNIYEHFKNSKSIKIFDAGGGTGNWAKFILNIQNGSVIIFDINPKMLKVAFKKLKLFHQGRYKTLEGNLEESSDYPAEKSDVIICLHCVIGFVRNTDKVLKNLYSHLAQNGLLILMAPNECHALNFSKLNNKLEEIERVLKDGTIKFKKDMPEIFCYTPNELKNKLISVGFKKVNVLGFPVTIYPNPIDTDPSRKDITREILIDKKKREELFEIEKQLSLNPKFAFRGNNLIAIAIK